MAKCKIEILPRAWKDLTSIEDYYYLQFDIESAQKVSDSILNFIETLEVSEDIKKELRAITPHNYTGI